MLQFVLILFVLISLSIQNTVLRASCLDFVGDTTFLVTFFLRVECLRDVFFLSLSVTLHKLHSIQFHYRSSSQITCLVCYPFRRELDASLLALLLHKSVSLLCIYMDLAFVFLESIRNQSISGGGTNVHFVSILITRS